MKSRYKVQRRANITRFFDGDPESGGGLSSPVLSLNGIAIIAPIEGAAVQCVQVECAP